MRAYKDWEIRQGIPEIEAQRAARRRLEERADGEERLESEDPLIAALMAHYKTARYQRRPS
jgi:hypothetical protein